MSFDSKRLGDVPLTHADITKAKLLIGDTPEVAMTDGVTRFVEWYKEVHEILQVEDE